MNERIFMASFKKDLKTLAKKHLSETKELKERYMDKLKKVDEEKAFKAHDLWLFIKGI